MDSQEQKTGLQVSDDKAASVQKTQNRVTLASIEDRIAGTEYLYPPSAPHCTIAVVTMKNGFITTGISAPADPANYNEALGREFAREQAVKKIWEYEGYLLRERLSPPPPSGEGEKQAA